jgi:hypothetical protein
VPHSVTFSGEDKPAFLGVIDYTDTVWHNPLKGCSPSRGRKRLSSPRFT